MALKDETLASPHKDGTPHGVSSGVYAADEKKADERPKGGKCIKCGSICAIVVGALFIIIGIVAASWFRGYVNTGLKELNVVNTDKKLDGLVNPTSQDDYVPKYRTVYLFNVKNPLAVRRGEVPQVEEVGPYNYEVIDKSDSYSFGDDGETYSYKSYTEFKFTQEGSCDECKDPTKEMITAWNPAYLRVMSSAFSEKFFAGILLKGLNVTNVPDLYTSLNVGSLLSAEEFTNIAEGFAVGSVNCLDTFNGTAVKVCVENMQKLLGALSSGGALAPADLIPIVRSDAVRGQYPGMFVTRTVEEMILGHPSFIAGVGVTSNYDKEIATDIQGVVGCGVNAKNPNPLWLQYCKPNGADFTCSGNPLLADADSCRTYCSGCSNAAKVVAFTETRFCPYYEQKLLQTLSPEDAKKIVAATCGRCSDAKAKSGGFFPYCMAPIPGALATFNLAAFSPPELEAYKASLPITSLYTGKDDAEKVQTYITFNGLKSAALWRTTVPNRSNPGTLDLLPFNKAGGLAQCDATPIANVSCMPVKGNPGTVVPGRGSSATGLNNDAPYAPTNEVYLSQANVPLLLTNDEGENVEVEGIKLFRFRPSKNLLTQDQQNVNFGFGYPVDGVQNLFFVNGFLAYLSYPFFLYGDASLLNSIQLTSRRNKGERVTPATLSDNQDFVESIRTYVDIEPASGSTMQAHKRVQASFAAGQNQMNLPYFDITAKANVYNLTKAEVIVPAYWVDENAVITSKKASTFKLAKGFASSTLPITIVGIVLGTFLLVAGVFLLRRAKSNTSSNANLKA